MKIINRAHKKEIQITLTHTEARVFVVDLETRTSHLALGIVDDIGDTLKTILEKK